MLGLHGPLEQALLRLDWSGTAIDLGERRKTAWLHQDLLALNFSEREIEAIPVCVEIPELTSVARGIGCLYVLEGSTLGGAVIARQLERVLEIGTDQGARFYASYGARLPMRSATAPWRRIRPVPQRMTPSHVSRPGFGATRAIVCQKSVIRDAIRFCGARCAYHADTMQCHRHRVSRVRVRHG
jgi:hypothetical protein